MKEEPPSEKYVTLVKKSFVPNKESRVNQLICDHTFRNLLLT